jgi:4-hydroxybenzoate polyprenyltransferase
MEAKRGDRLTGVGTFAVLIAVACCAGLPAAAALAAGLGIAALVGVLAGVLALAGLIVVIALAMRAKRRGSPPTATRGPAP